MHVKSGVGRISRGLRAPRAAPAAIARGDSRRSRQALQVCASIPVKRAEDVHLGARGGRGHHWRKFPRMRAFDSRAGARSQAPAPPPRRRPAVDKLPQPVPRNSLRMGLPSKGRMAEDTIQLLKVGVGGCGPGSLASAVGEDALPPRQLRGSTQAPLPRPPAAALSGARGPGTRPTLLPAQDSALSVYKPNPRQYVASIPQVTARPPGPCRRSATATATWWWCTRPSTSATAT